MRLWPFTPNPEAVEAERLLHAVVAASRQPTLYAPGRAPDTLEGRLEMLMLHGVLALIRLAAEPGGEPLAQRFTDMLFRHFDSGLREAGVGDLAVPKRMHRLAGDFYGRLEAYRLGQERGREALAAALARNALADVADADALALADYALALFARLAGATRADLGAPQVWDAA